MEVNESNEKKSAILDEQRIETFNYYKTSVPENKLLSDFLLRARGLVKICSEAEYFYKKPPAMRVVGKSL